MSNKTEFILSARDDTRAAFESVNRSLSNISGSSVDLAGSLTKIGMATAGLAGAGSVAAFAAQVQTAITAMGDLKDASEQTGASVENLSALKGIAKLSGTEFENVTGAINKMSKALHGTDDESKGAGKALAALGLNITALRDMDPAEAFLEIAKAQDKFADGGGKTAAMMAILGKSAAQTIPFMKDLAEAQTLSGKVTSEQAAAADEYDKNLKRLQMGWSSLSRTMAAAVVGPAKDVTDWMVEANKKGGILYATLVGIGAAFAKAVGVETNQTKLADEAANAAFSKVANLRKMLEDAEAGKSKKGWFGESLGLDDPAELREQLAGAERELRSAIRRRDKLVKDATEAAAPKSNALDKLTFGKEGTEKDAKPKKIAAEGQAIKDYDAILTERVVNAIEKLDTVKAQELVATLARLDQMAAAGLDPAIVKAVRDDLTGATKAAADETARLNKLLAQTDTEKLKEAEKDINTLIVARDAGRISEAQFAEASVKRFGEVTEKVKEQTDLVKELGMTFTSAFEEAVVGGRKASEIFKALAMDLAKLALRKAVTEPMLNSVGTALKGFDWSQFFSGATANAKGGVYSSPSLSAFSGGVYNSPRVFAFAKGAGIFGEAGPEAIMPLSRGADGKLGVKAQGSSPNVNITVNNQAASQGFEATATARQNGSGFDIEVLVAKAVLGDQRRNGPITQGFGQMFNLARGT